MPNPSKPQSNNRTRQVSSRVGKAVSGSASVSKGGVGSATKAEKSEREKDLEEALAAAQLEISRLTCGNDRAFDRLTRDVGVSKIAVDMDGIVDDGIAAEPVRPPGGNLMNSLPKVELTPFDGNPIGYWKFIRQFEYYVESKTCDPGQRLLYLMHYCRGKARKAIDACVMLPPDDAYPRARTILKDMFGLPHVVARSLLDDLLSEAKQVKNNATSLSELALKMENCQISLVQMRCEADLNSITTLEGIVACLPLTIQHQWAEFVDELNCDGLDVTFKELTQFISRRARIARSRFGQLIENSYTRAGRAYPSSNEQRVADRRRVNMAVSTPSVSCCLCKRPHELQCCPLFLEKDVRSRWQIAKRNTLCFICLRRSHNASDCKVQELCSVNNCGRRHHASLHFERSWGESNEKVNCSYTAFSANVCLGYLPVKIETPKGPVKAVAFLDSGSDTTLVRRDFAETYCMPGCPTNVSISTLGHHEKLSCSRLAFNVQSLDGMEVVHVPEAYTVDTLPEVSPHSLRFARERYAHLSDLEFDDVDDRRVTILIGCNVPEAHWVLEQRLGNRSQPFASKTILGWIVQGPTGRNSKSVYVANCEGPSVDLDEQLTRMYNAEFADLCTDDTGNSRNDDKALRIAEGTKLLNGHFQVPLPWKESDVSLVNNYDLAERRLNLLRRRFVRDSQLFDRYAKVLQHHFDSGHIENIPLSDSIGSRVWYLPHHPVFNPRKPEKCRIVFDCAAKYKYVSLNDVLHQGPNLNNNLVDVLLRFRLHQIAFGADIKEMFLQVAVPPMDRDALRLLWWPNNDMTSPPKAYRMTVHPFGATSSPFCATYALRKTAECFGHMFDERVSDYITSNFYVDDCLVSVSTVDEAKSTIDQLSEILKCGGFELTKWISNDPDVLGCIPLEKRAPGVRSICRDKLPTQRILGVKWDASLDEFELEFCMPECRLTRRGLLSMVSSMYDPLGLMSPWILPGKDLLQRTCKQKLGWDEPLSDELVAIFHRWVEALGALAEIRVPRWIGVPHRSGVSIELHIFCDASEVGHGAVAYGCIIDQGSRSPARILFSKSRVNPVKAVPIPRLELAAAVLSVRIYVLLRRAIGDYIGDVVFWTDSMIVLHYINNDSTRFATYVANRLTMIHGHTEPRQWRHVSTELNPADLTSRGALDLCRRDLWLNGPEFIRYSADSWPEFRLKNDCIGQMELKRTTCNAVMSTSVNELTSLLHKFSDWMTLIRSVAWLARFKCYIKMMFGKSRDASIVIGPLRVLEIRRSELDVIRLVQVQAFGGRTDIKSIPKRLIKLNVFYRDGVIRVGGRLRRSCLGDSGKHPIILPKDHHVTGLLIRFVHLMEAHAGASHTLHELRKKYWVLDGLSSVKRELSKCVTCRKLDGRPGVQLMSDLPAVRVSPGWYPFAEVGLDYFGPFNVKRGRSLEKRYGCLFTCLKCRAVHIELAHSMTTDSFLMALFRFIGRRGQPEHIYSDNGSNFVGADRVLRTSLAEIDQERVCNRLSSRGIQWTFNPPDASHRGGVWERLIRSVRRALNAMCLEQTPSDETLATAFVEVERILNNRPLVPIYSGDIDSLSLCPNDLLIQRPNGTIAPDVGFADQFRRNWKQSVYLTDVFWKRWRAEYLPLLQNRQKWLNPSRNFQSGDVLIVSNDTPRKTWSLGVVEEAEPSDDGLVRSVMIRTSNGTLHRDVRKLCLLEGCGDVEQPDHQGESVDRIRGIVPDLGAPSGRRVSGSVASRNTTECPTGRRGSGRCTGVNPIGS